MINIDSKQIKLQIWDTVRPCLCSLATLMSRFAVPVLGQSLSLDDHRSDCAQIPKYCAIQQELGQRSSSFQQMQV